MSQIIRIDNDKAFGEALHLLRQSAIVGLDTETTALLPSPDNPAGKVRLIQLAHDEQTPAGVNRICYVVDTFAFEPSNGTMRAFVSLLESKRTVKVAHNAKFDLRWLMWEIEHRWLGSRVYPEAMFCTYLASILINGGRKDGGNSLAAVAAAYLQINVQKELQLSDWSAPVLTDAQIQYAALDALLMLDLHPAMSKVLIDYYMLRTAAIEFDACPAIADMENNGMPLDRQMWSDLLVIKTQERDEALDKLMVMLQQACNWTVRNPAKVGARPVKPKKDYRKPVKPKLHAAKTIKSGTILRSEEYENALKEWEGSEPDKPELHDRKAVKDSPELLAENVKMSEEYAAAKATWKALEPVKKDFRFFSEEVDSASLQLENDRLCDEYDEEVKRWQSNEAAFAMTLAEWQSEFDKWAALPDQIPATINLNSSVQVARALRNLGVPVKATNEKALNELMQKLEVIGDGVVDRIYPEPPARVSYMQDEGGQAEFDEAVAAHQAECQHVNSMPSYTGNQAKVALGTLLDYRGAEKSVGSFGLTYLEAIQGDGVIRTEFRQIGAETTGRMSSGGGINLQQVPHDERHRHCFKAPAGHVMIGTDYSAIEPRILAQFSGDENLRKIFADGRDAYKVGASMMYGVAYEMIQKAMRNGFKAILLGLNYGMGAGSLSVRLGVDFEEATKQKRLFFNALPKVEIYLDAAGQQMRTYGWTRTGSGRLLWFAGNLLNDEEAAAAERLGKNAPIQGTSADITKLALALIFRRLRNTSGRLRSVVHDEVIVTALAGEGKQVAKIVQEAMIEAAQTFVPDVKIIADPLTADRWVKELHELCIVCEKGINFADEAAWAYVEAADARHATCDLRAHKWHKCDSEGCFVCRADLSQCVACGLAEGELTTHCPKQPPTEEQRDLAYAGKLDFVDGQWIEKQQRQLLAA